MDALPDLFWTMIKRFANDTRLDPFEVADSMARRLEVLREKPGIVEYEAVGGPAVPFSESRLVVALGEHVTWNAKVAPGIDIPAIEALSHWYGAHYGISVADPEDRQNLATLRVKVPVGQLDILLDGHSFHVRRIILYDRVIQRWQGEPPPPPPVARRLA